MRTIAIILLLLLSSAVVRAQEALTISRLTGDFYVYATYSTYQGKRISANGMYLLTSEGAVLFDTPWDTTQFQPLLDSIRARHGQRVRFCIATHFHADRTGGLEYYRSRGVATYTTRMTDSLSARRGMKRAEHLLHGDSSFTVGSYRFRVIYPGPGHAPDNIVIWFPRERVLYGGCLIKSVADSDLGNLGDASRSRYAGTVRAVLAACPSARYVVTGHNSWQDPRSLRHTLRLAERLRRQAGREKQRGAAGAGGRQRPKS
ncbi:subclass B1 metallo-beta-lactamase [Flaviaesturariibacter amylovorans]|uniref:Beta-lactamase n=1 Tax=Flaviaesturariibacter amylovorans TaxID=1084520 RepID=A0ABP8HSV0_9BACT